jgi:hypothetical protein
MLQESRPRWENQLQKEVHTVAAPIYGLLFMSGVGVFVYQCFRWLKTGLWEELSLANVWPDLFKTQPPFADWGGIFKLESAVPVSLFLVGMGIVTAWLTFLIFSFPSEVVRPKEKDAE